MFKATVHEIFADFDGDPHTAFDLARTSLVFQGFEVLSESDTELRARGPGMHSNQQPPILGVSDLCLRIIGSKISARATLGGVLTMKLFLLFFPPGLVLSLCIMGMIDGKIEWWVPFAFLVPWFMIAPAMGSALERTTVKAVDAMVRGMSQVGKPKSQ